MHVGLALILLTGIFVKARALEPGADQCGENIRITSANYLTSPGYPASYVPSQRCVWVISAPAPHQRILINFNPHFDLEDRECKTSASALSRWFSPQNSTHPAGKANTLYSARTQHTSCHLADGEESRIRHGFDLQSSG
ncbi:neuropilin-1a isoform X1 [Tachysurus ichikawai]